MEKKRIAAYIFCSIYDIKTVQQYKQSITKFAKEKLKINETQIDFYVDNTKREQRVEINRLMEEIKRGRYDVLMLYHCTHLYKIRNTKGLNRYIEIERLIHIRDVILNNGVKIYSVEENKSIE